MNYLKIINCKKLKNEIWGHNFLNSDDSFYLAIFKQVVW